MKPVEEEVKEVQIGFVQVKEPIELVNVKVNEDAIAIDVRIINKNHTSEIQVLCLMKCSGENVLLLFNTITYSIRYIFLF